MTSASVVAGSSAAQQGNGSGKTRSSSREEDETAIPPEFLAFADLFTQLTGEEVPAAASAAMPVQAPIAAPMPASANAESKEESSALQVAATHSQWFGADDGALAEPVLRRKPPVVIREPAGAAISATGLADDEGIPLPPALVADMALAKQQAALAAETAAAQQAASLPQPAVDADEGAVLAAQAELPRGDLLRFQAAMMRPNAQNAAGAGSQTAKNRATSAETTSPGGPQSASKVQQSLSALQAALSERSLSGSEVEASGDSADATRQMMKDANITSVRQETHFAPVSQSPAQQIAQRILGDLATGGARAIEPSANLVPPAKPPVRVLNIQLDPPQLGPMTIRLSMQDEALRLHLETPNPETAKMIQNERDGLSRVLRSAGYAVDGVQIQVAPADRGAGGQPSTSQQGFGQASGQQSAWREPQSDGRGAERGWQGPQDDESGKRGADRGPSQAQPGRTTRGVYL